MVKEVLEFHEFSTSFRVVFRDENGKSEIDIIAKRFNLILGIDAKRYTERWYRLSALKREAKKHAERCQRFEKMIGRRVIPVIVPLIDDELHFHEGCIIVPFSKFNDFIVNIHTYLTIFGFI